MKESYGEGPATHTDPESCADVRKGGREALTGVRAGRVWEPRKSTPERRRCKEKRKATSGASISQDATGLRAVRDPVHVRKRLAREPGDPGCNGRRRWADALRLLKWSRGVILIRSCAGPCVDRLL